MKRPSFICLTGFFLIFILSGCLVRTYQLTRQRVDQDLEIGNRGYLQGETPEISTEEERKTTRTTRVVEIELRSPIKFERKKDIKPEVESQSKTTTKKSDQGIWGNRGFISETSQIMEQKSAALSQSSETKKSSPDSEKYTVQKGDTLQKISQKFYGTTRKWNKIYRANTDILKGPDKIYPGQVIDIPTESSTSSLKTGLKEPQVKFK